MESKRYYVYMLRCEGDSIYTGITTDIERRTREHLNKEDKCAKYTVNHPAKKLEISWETENRILASKLEYHIKKLSKKEKEELIKKPKEMENLLGDKIDASMYSVLEGGKING